MEDPLRIETSQQQKENKSNEIPLVLAKERGLKLFKNYKNTKQVQFLYIIFNKDDLCKSKLNLIEYQGNPFSVIRNGYTRMHNKKYREGKLKRTRDNE